MSLNFLTCSTKEYVGVDDEYMYGVVPIAQPEPVDNAQPENTQASQTTENVIAQPDLVDNAHPGNTQATQTTENAPTAAGGAMPAEVEVSDYDPQVIHVLHNPENPYVRKGALFPDIIAFRKAIRHHAIKKDFKFHRVQTDKTRFRAECAHEGCPWRIHASVLQDNKTVEVIVSLYFLSYQFCMLLYMVL